MKLSPVDLRQQGFPHAVRGFDRAAVNAFLVRAAEDYEAALLEIERLRRDLAAAEIQLQEHRGRDTTLRNALLTAQRVADDIKEMAQQESKAVMREAEGRAALLLEKAQGRLDDVERDIEDLRVRRHELEESVGRSVAAIRQALESVKNESRNDDKILLHRRRVLDPSTLAAERTADAAEPSENVDDRRAQGGQS